MNKGTVFLIISTLLIILLFCVSMIIGAVDIPVSEVISILSGKTSEKASWQYIVLQSRLPQTITAMLCGGALAVSGLMLQTAFRNPLADPGIFGINSGA
ncbi:MAG: iron chelate uptake ABC transporter family permease subunit, partial [Prevotella sp.]|nr:iron chelate uptake ABC transporter family permease subunit [Prevotella sp.]